MATKKILVTLTFKIDAEYDPESPAFLQAKQDYNDAICTGGEDDFVSNVVYQAIRQGAHNMIEGAGYVKCNGRITDESLFCGVSIDDDDPAPEIEIQDY